MSDLGIVVICLTLIVITAIISTAWYNINKVDPEEQSRQRLVDAGNRLHQALQEPRGKDLWLPASATKIEYPDPPEPEPELEPEPDSMAPIPVDPSNPPHVRTYRRQPGSTASTPICTCHGRKLQEGQEILWWPIPDSGAVKVFCQQENS